MSNLSNLRQTHALCDGIRQILGRGIMPGSDAYNMRKRLEDARNSLNSLKELAKKTPALLVPLQKHADRFRQIGEQAEELRTNTVLPQAEKEKRIVTVSEKISLLKHQINMTIASQGSDRTSLKALDKARKKINKKAPEVARREFEEHVADADRILEELQTCIPLDEHRQLKEAKDETEREARGEENFETGTQQLAAQIGELKTRLTNGTQEKKNWKSAGSGRVAAVKEAIKRVSPTGPLAGEQFALQNELVLAIHAANELRNYFQALEHLTKCEAMVSDIAEKDKVIQDKIDNFKTRVDALTNLMDDTNMYLAKIRRQFKNRASGAAKKVAEEDILKAVGPIGIAHARLGELMEHYEQRSINREGWGGYPKELDTAENALRQQKIVLDQLFQDKSDEDLDEAVIEKVNELIKGFNDESALNELRNQWSVAESKATTQLKKLESTLGSLSDDYMRAHARYDKALKSFAIPNLKAVEDLDELATELESLITNSDTRKQELLAAGTALAKEWKDSINIWGRLNTPSKYVDGLKSEFTMLTTVYADGTDNLDTMEEGVTKLRAVVERMKSVMGGSEGRKEVKGTIKTFEEIAELLKDKKLRQHRAHGYASLNFEYSELEKAGTVQTEDPKTMQPKLNELKKRVEDEIALAEKVAAAKEEIEAMRKVLEPLLKGARTRIAAHVGAVPKDYASSFDADVKLLVNAALLTEEEAKVKEKLTSLDSIKTKLENFATLTPLQLEEHMDTVEMGHLTVEIEKEEQLEKQQQKWESAWERFENQTMVQCGKAVGQVALHAMPRINDKMKNVKTKRSEAKKQAKSGDYRGALSTLQVALVLAQDLIGSPTGSKTADSLRGLDTKWETAVTDFRNDMDALLNKVAEECKKIDAHAGDQLETKLKPLCEGLRDALDPNAFKKPVADLLKDDLDNPKATAEKALQDVRKGMKFVENPLLKSLVANPFGVQVRTAPLFRTLRSLEVNLQTVL